MRIEYLADHPELVDELALLHFAQWGSHRPEQTLEQRAARLVEQCGRGGVPSVVVALEDGKLCGSAMLTAADMDSRPDLTPWLAGVYVVAACRGRGYGSALVRRIEEEAARSGIRTLYLYTPDAMNLYAGLGWIAGERVPYLGEDVTVMSRELSQEAAERT